MADWSCLPANLLDEIALKMDSIEDFICFSAVCRSWNDASSMVKSSWIPNTLTPPWLLLGEPNNNDEGCRKIFSVAKNKCYRLKLPQTFGARCWGSSYGWIVMVHLDRKVELFNPITKAQLSLPPLQTMPLPEDIDEDDGRDDWDDWFHKIFVSKFVVLKMTRRGKDDIHEQEFVVMAIHWPMEHLAFARPGDQAWTRVITTCRRPRQVADVFCWDRLVLVLYQDGSLAYCDVNVTHDNRSGVPVIAKEYLPAPPNIFKSVMSGIGEMYIVELGGELHVVSRFKASLKYKDKSLSYRTEGFEVHKLDPKTKVWEKVEDLGEYMLFVGYNVALPIHISKATTNCQRNVIYYTDDAKELRNVKGYCGRGHDMGMYDMASRELKAFYEGEDRLCMNSAPIWFIPTF